MSKIQKIEIDFAVLVDLPDGWEQALDSLIGIVCKQYQQQNPDKVMWPAGCGQKPIWNEPNEPTYDETIYHIEVAEREDLYGQNPHNPDRERLRAEAAAMRAARKKTNKTSGQKK